jgi:hypothetical protein
VLGGEAHGLACRLIRVVANRGNIVELREFISTVLVSVVRGVEDAQSELKDSKASINPLGIKAQIALEQNKDTPAFTNVEFEVGVEVQNKDGQGGHVGVRIALFRAGVEGKSLTFESHVSRLRFAVPVHLPPGDVLKPQ